MPFRTDAVNKNLDIYNSAEVTSHYAGLCQITPCEHLLFETYIKAGAAVLDLGVGGGRTTSYLSQRASRYLGVDYAAEMVRVCQAKFPNLNFMVGEGSNLCEILSHSFDAVVAAFNVVDYVIGPEDRARCWQECYRILRPGGVFIFSSHNPRAVLVRPNWNGDRVRQLSMRIAPAGGLVEKSTRAVLNCGAALLATARAGWGTPCRLVRQSQYAAFWLGEGYVVDPAHGGLLTHYWVPGKVLAELRGHGFHIRKILGDDYPRRSSHYWTDWYYYVFEKPEY